MSGYINWNLAGGNNNALASFGQGMQLGNYISQKREEKERDSALAAYAADPSETNFAGLAKAAPAYAMQERDRMDARQAQRTAQRREDAGTFRQLLGRAAQSPEGWSQAITAAQQMGLDISGVPQQYDPQWAQSQMFILDALESDEVDLPSIAQEVMLAMPPEQRDPNSPEFREALGRAIEGKYAVEYTDANGNIRRRSVLRNPAAPPPQAIQALRDGVGTPEQFDAMFGPGAAKRVLGQQGGPTQPASGGF